MISKTYVINLARRSDKKAHMENEFLKLKNNNIDLNHEFFEGVDGSDANALSQYDFSIPNWFDPNSGKAMTNGEVGCAISHYCIWKKIIDAVEKGELDQKCNVLILEDDVVFMDDFQNKLINYIAEVPDLDYDMIYVHRKPLNLAEEIKLSHHINGIKKSYWTCGYILTYLGAKKLINANYLDNLIPVDEFFPAMYGCKIFGFEKLYHNHGELKCYAVCPSLLKLTGNAFIDSETVHSNAYTNNSSFKFGNGKEFTMIYVGTSTPDEAYLRFQNHCNLYGIPCITIDNSNGMSDIDLIKTELRSWSSRLANTLLMVASVSRKNSCEILPIGSPTEIIDKYLYLTASIENKILITECDDNLGITLFCSWANNLENILSDVDPKIKSIGTLLSIKSYTTNDIITDRTFEIFQPLDKTNHENINYNHRTSRISNKFTKTTPPIVFARDNRGTLVLNKIENYTGNGWNEYYGSRIPSITIEFFPKIFVSVKISSSCNNSVLNFFNLVDYPRDRLIIKLNDTTKDKQSDNNIYHKDILDFLDTDCDYYFFINEDCILTNPLVLKELLSFNKNVIAPLIRRGTETWTNFWGDLDDNGYYSRSFDYLDIINSSRQGCWNVPYISGTYLIKRDVVKNLPDLFMQNNHMDPDMRMCFNLRENNIFMYVTNMNNYGYITHVEESPIQNIAPVIFPQESVPGEITLYDIFTNKEKWEEKYLHSTYYRHKNNLATIPYTELCNDIYSFPLFSEAFCKEIIQMAETYGKWSKGKDEHSDPRLGKGYYENVPTVDIQLFELQMEKQWKEIVFSYIAPMAKVLYNNYKTKDINLAFVVRYKFDDQKSLAPHHDASTYTVNIALNRGNGIDYTGGGCRFIRQNYILRNQEPGMCSIHAGRLVCFHEGLPVDSGTRYILVSFIN